MISGLSELPSAENSLFEFKSSQTPTESLGRKLCKAASAFSNSGGGTFLAGVDDDGNADGGITPNVGRTSILDWIDTKLQLVRPAVSYDVETFDSPGEKGSIHDGKIVVAVEFSESRDAPHMSDDNIYYIRAGAHSSPASSFLVEALLAKRDVRRPLLSYLFRIKPTNTSAIQLSILTLTSAPAVDVILTLDPLGGSLSGAAEMFPLNIPVIDDTHPFEMDYGVAVLPSDGSGREIALKIYYKGMDGASYSLERKVDPYNGISQVNFEDDVRRIAKALEKIASPNS